MRWKPQNPSFLRSLRFFYNAIESNSKNWVPFDTWGTDMGNVIFRLNHLLVPPTSVNSCTASPGLCVTYSRTEEILVLEFHWACIALQTKARSRKKGMPGSDTSAPGSSAEATTSAFAVFRPKSQVQMLQNIQIGLSEWFSFPSHGRSCSPNPWLLCKSIWKKP